MNYFATKTSFIWQSQLLTKNKIAERYISYTKMMMLPPLLNKKANLGNDIFDEKHEKKCAQFKIAALIENYFRDCQV